MPFSRGLCHVEINQLIGKVNWLTGFYIVWVFAGGYFRTDYNTVLFSQAAIEKCSSVTIPVVGLF